MDVIAEAIVTRVRKHPLREVAEGVLVQRYIDFLVVRMRLSVSA
jgi:hypothetical protein